MKPLLISNSHITQEWQLIVFIAVHKNQNKKFQQKLVAKILKIKVHEIQFISENIKKRDVVYHKNLGHPRFETHLVLSTTPHYKHIH